MSNGDDRLIGEIHGMVKQQGEHLRDLGTLLRDVRENGCPVGKVNREGINTNANKIERNSGLLWKITVILSGVIGADKVIEFFMK